MYQIDQLGPLLVVIGQSGAVLVGGQAINLWSERYQREAEPWLSLRPFTSADVDLLGSQADAKACAVGLGGTLELPDDPAHTPNAAKVHCRNPEIDLDVLHTVNGLNTAEAVQTAVRLRYRGLPLRLRTHARSQAGLDVQRRHDLDFLQAVPVELWRQIPGPLSDWCRTEAPLWQDEVRQRIGDIEEIARWVRELKERPRTE